MKKNNNKGAALISVLVAMMFIAILATSLIYMSYMNYETKSMRWAATDSFYYDEFALDDLTAEMQELCAAQPDIPTAISVLEAKSGVSGGTYSPAALETNFLHIANTGNLEVHLSTPDGCVAEYSKSGDVATYKNLKITTTDPVRGYTSSIVVDFQLGVRNGGKIDLDVNDFSIISDTPVDWTRGGDMMYGGSIFVMSPDWVDSLGSGSPSGTAITISGVSNVTCAGPRGIIVGDVVIENGAQLQTSGRLIVTGNIIVKTGGVLSCNSNLQVGGTIQCDSTSKVIGTAHQSASLNVADYFGDGQKYKNGLANVLLCDFFVYDKDGNLQEIKSTDADGNYIPGGTLAVLNSSSTYLSGGGPKDHNNGVYCNMRFEADDMTAPDGSAEYQDALIFLPRWSQTRKNFTGSTVICPKGGGAATSGDTTVGVDMTHLDDEKYKAAKETLMSELSKNGTFVMQDGTIADMNTVVESCRSSFSIDTVTGVETFDGAVAGENIRITSWISGGEVRYAVYKDGKSYLPYGYLIDGGAPQILSDLFEGIENRTDPTNSDIIITRWEKQ